MKKTKKKDPAAVPVANTGAETIPPGATTRAFERPTNDEHGPGQSAGPRHAAAEPGSVDEEYGAVDSNDPLAEPRTDESPEGPPYADRGGHPAEGSPASK